jgi:hypothetical protein
VLLLLVVLEKPDWRPRYTLLETAAEAKPACQPTPVTPEPVLLLYPLDPPTKVFLLDVDEQ